MTSYKKTFYVSLFLVVIAAWLGSMRFHRQQCANELAQICAPYKGLMAIYRCAPYKYETFSPVCRTQIKYQYLANYRIMKLRDSVNGKTFCRCGDEPDCDLHSNPAHREFHSLRRQGNFISLVLFGQTLATARRTLTDDPFRARFCGK